MALGVRVWTRLLEESLLPQQEPGTLRARGGVVIVAIPGNSDRMTGSDPYKM